MKTKKVRVREQTEEVPLAPSQWLACPPCPICGGHVDTSQAGEHNPIGGLMPILRRQGKDGAWYMLEAACDCAYGERYRKARPNIRRWSEDPGRLRGLARADISLLFGYLRHGDSLADAAMRITEPPMRDRIMRAIEDLELAERQEVPF